MLIQKGESVDSFKEMSLMEYTRNLASKSPTPGGGGTAALTAALAISLGNMVGSLTVGKKKYRDVEDELKELMRQGDALRLKLLDLIDQDAAAFQPLADAYGLPKETEEEKRYKQMVLEEALRQAAEVPMEILRTSAEVISLLEAFAKHGSRLALSDAGCGAALAEAAVKSAALNVTINTKLMKDRETAKALNSEVLELMTVCSNRASAVCQSVYEELIQQ